MIVYAVVCEGICALGKIHFRVQKARRRSLGSEMGKGGAALSSCRDID